MVSVKEARDRLLEGLIQAGIDKGECWREVDLIIEHVTGYALAEQILHENEALPPEKWHEMRAILARRQGREPLQYCLGYTYFRGLKLQVESGVFIPRPDTEALVDIVLSMLPPGASSACEIGAGSGAIAIALLKENKDLEMTAIELSECAFKTARQNAASHGVSGRLKLILADWRQALPFDLHALVSNPPYIAIADKETLSPEIRLFEPEMALYGGADGLLEYRLISWRRHHLKHGGFVALEVGDGQSAAVLDIFKEAGWLDARVHADIHGQKRFVTAVATRE